MKRMLLLFAASLLLLVPGAARAQYLNVGWGDSPTNGASNIQPSTCQTDAGVNRLVFSFVPATDLHAVSAFLLDLTAVVGDGGTCDAGGDPNGCIPSSLPPYWNLTPGTGCRAGAVSASLDFGQAPFVSSTQVTDPWQGGFQLLAQPWNVQTKTAGSPPQNYTVGRYQLTGQAAPGDSVDLLAGHEYYVAIVTFTNARSVVGGCDGCCTSILFKPVLEVALRDHSVIMMANVNSGPPLWQGQQGQAACQGVPVRHSTWGSLKSAYR
jgi:hypothetical protein